VGVSHIYIGMVVASSADWPRYRKDPAQSCVSQRQRSRNTLVLQGPDDIGAVARWSTSYHEGTREWFLSSLLNRVPACEEGSGTSWQLLARGEGKGRSKFQSLTAMKLRMLKADYAASDQLTSTKTASTPSEDAANIRERPRWECHALAANLPLELELLLSCSHAYSDSGGCEGFFS
jgi:hypothetical protein